MARRLILGLLVCAAPVCAQLTDPTRPPVSLPVATGSPTGDAQAPAGLQSILLGRDGKTRPAAVINGTVVQLGGMLGEQRLVQVAENYVVLLGPEGRETLTLTPAVEKITKVGAGKTAVSIGMNAQKGEPPKGERKQ